MILCKPPKSSKLKTEVFHMLRKNKEENTAFNVMSMYAKGMSNSAINSQLELDFKSTFDIF